MAAVAASTLGWDLSGPASRPLPLISAAPSATAVSSWRNRPARCAYVDDGHAPGKVLVAVAHGSGFSARASTTASLRVLSASCPRAARLVFSAISWRRSVPISSARRLMNSIIVLVP